MDDADLISKKYGPFEIELRRRMDAFSVFMSMARYRITQESGLAHTCATVTYPAILDALTGTDKVRSNAWRRRGGMTRSALEQNEDTAQLHSLWLDIIEPIIQAAARG